MDKAYRSKLLKQADKAAIDGNTMLADGLKLLCKIYDDIDYCVKAEKRIAKRGEYTDAIRIQGQVDAWKKTAWDLQKVLNLR